MPIVIKSGFDYFQRCRGPLNTKLDCEQVPKLLVCVTLAPPAVAGVKLYLSLHWATDGRLQTQLTNGGALG